MINIDIGASRKTLLKFASDIQEQFSRGGTEDITLYAHSNSSSNPEEIQIRFSNEDMDDRDDIPADSVFVEIERS